MGSISIIRQDITRMDVDAIVNAANEDLLMGGGVCGAIFQAAGKYELQAACDQIGHCPTGGAVITPGFRLKARHVIHAVGPIYHDGRHGEPEALYGAYHESLMRARENGLTSIAFPLISAGIFGYPKQGAWERALAACTDYLKAYPDEPMDIYITVLDDAAAAYGNAVLSSMQG